MKWNIQQWLVSILLASTSACTAQTPLPTASSNNTLLWEISGNGLQQPSYFLGTMHILCQQDAWISPAMQSILDEAGVVYFEADLDNMMEMVSLFGSMSMKNGTRLSDLLSAEEYQLVKDYMSKKMPLPFSMLDKMKPMLLSSLVADQSLPCETGQGMEMILMKEAKKRSLSIKGLETLKSQAAIFDSIPYDYQAKSLLRSVQSAVNDPEARAPEMDSLLQAYRNQDLDAIVRLTNEESAADADANIAVDFNELLLGRRNRLWVDQFDSIARKQKTLFAVGAAHLPGPEGVLDLLKKKGYTLRPLENKKAASTATL